MRPISALGCRLCGPQPPASHLSASWIRLCCAAIFFLNIPWPISPAPHRHPSHRKPPGVREVGACCSVARAGGCMSWPRSSLCRSCCRGLLACSLLSSAMHLLPFPTAHPLTDLFPDGALEFLFPPLRFPCALFPPSSVPFWPPSSLCRSCCRGLLACFSLSSAMRVLSSLSRILLPTCFSTSLSNHCFHLSASHVPTSPLARMGLGGKTVHGKRRRGNNN